MKTNSSDSNHFDAPWGRSLKVITAVALVLLIGITVIAVTTVRQPRYMVWLEIGLPAVIIGGTALYTVRGYTVRNTLLVIHRPLWNKEVLLNGLQSATHDPGALRNSLRVFGNGGLFAFTGIFWNRKLGIYRAYVTDLNRAVVLKLRNRTVVVSPDDVDRFLTIIAGPDRGDSRRTE